MQWTELIVFSALFLLVTVMGFVAAKWQKGDTLEHLDEWGLGGRKFGSWITWFLVGGDLYTAYTFVAVPALMFGAGAMGFFALPYTVILYPIVFLPLVRMWSVSRVHGYVTPADFVKGRYGSHWLALLIAITGIFATMPYIALQLVGLEAVLRSMGLNGSGILGHAPLFVAFVILAVYTYQSGLRAPALIAFVKDILIYIVILVAIVYLPAKFGGWGEIFNDADAKFKATPAATDGILLNANNQLQYATLALGSALALFIYPHSLTGILASRGRNVIKRNMVALPAYSLVLGLLALLGYVAISAGTKPIVNQATGRPDTNTIVPELFGANFPSWFAGIAFAAIGIGALVPAAIMSIAAANLWTRNVYKEYVKKNATPAEEAKQAKLASAGRQVRRGRVHRVHRPAVLDRPAAHRRRDHSADAAGRRHRALHPLVPRLGTRRGLVRGHGLRDVPAVPHPQRRQVPPALRRFGVAAQQAVDLRLAPVRRLHDDDLRRHHRAGGEPDLRRDRHADRQEGQGLQRHRPDRPVRLPRRRGQSAREADRGPLRHVR